MLTAERPLQRGARTGRVPGRRAGVRRLPPRRLLLCGSIGATSRMTRCVSRSIQYSVSPTSKSASDVVGRSIEDQVHAEGLPAARAFCRQFQGIGAISTIARGWTLLQPVRTGAIGGCLGPVRIVVADKPDRRCVGRRFVRVLEAVAPGPVVMHPHLATPRILGVRPHQRDLVRRQRVVGCKRSGDERVEVGRRLSAFRGGTKRRHGPGRCQALGVRGACSTPRRRSTRYLPVAACRTNPRAAART